MASEPKMTCNATFNRDVPMNITAVNNPHMNRYAAIAVALVGVAHPNFGKTISATTENQNKP